MQPDGRARCNQMDSGGDDLARVSRSVDHCDVKQRYIHEAMIRTTELEFP